MATPVEVSSSGSASRLTGRRLSALAHFKDISGISEDDIAQNILESNGWDLERAVHSFMGYSDPGDQHVRRRNLPLPTVDISPRNQHVYFAPRHPSPWYIQLTSFALTPIRLACNVFLDLLKLLPITDPEIDVRNFIEDFKRRYLPPHQSGQDESDSDTIMPSPPMPPFYNGTYSGALREAKESLRFLIIYLHGDSHEDSDAFCRDTLLDPVFLDFINNSDQLLFWACNVNSAEGYRVSQTLREHTYPFIGVVGLSSNPVYSQTSFGSPTRMALLGRIEGVTAAPVLVEQLTNIINSHQSVLVAERADRAEREMSMRLRQEQDEAFAASLAQDRAKAAERAAHAEAQRREELMSRAHHRRQLHWAASLPAEPSPAISAEAVRLSIKLPDGRRAQRLFSTSDSVKLLYYFVIAQEDAPKRFAVESNYPKRIIECCPENESDIEEYIPQEEGDEVIPEKATHKQVDDWKPKGPKDPPSFKDVGLDHPEMLLILDLDS